MNKVKAFIARKIIAAKAAIKRKTAIAATKNLVLFSVQTPEDYTQYVKDIELLDNEFAAFDAIILTTNEMAPKFVFHPARKVFSTKELNFFEIPKKEVVAQFENAAYNYIINSCETECFALDYIATICQAKLKIGVYKPGRINIYDLLLNPETADNQKEESFIALTLRYLQKINTNNEK